jgi:O-methyltransferase involved in polyketide biosynthesis
MTYQAVIGVSALLVSVVAAQYSMLARRNSTNHCIDNTDQAYTSVHASKYRSPKYTFEERKAIAASVGVKPPSQLPQFMSKVCMKAFRKTLQLAHVFDTLAPPNSFLSLSCMWWKAIAANDATSPVHDRWLAYDLLPAYSRWIVSPWLVLLYPRMLHANLEIRTAFLDRAVTQIATATTAASSASIDTSKRTAVRLITLGGGYDTRSMKLLERGVIQQAVELDLPTVVQAKQRLLSSKRFQSRRQGNADVALLLPTLYAVDLNEVARVREILEELFATQETEDTVTIFLFEAVFLYLNPGVPTALLQLCSDISKGDNSNSWLALVDRLEGFDGDDRNHETARQVLAKSNWDLVDYSPKHGATRHMVRARLANSS